MTASARLKAVVVAGHRGDTAVVTAGLADADPRVRSAALGAASRCGQLTDERLAAALGDDSPQVRRRACELAATRPDVDLLALADRLTDDDPTVVEVAAWACGERLEGDADPDPIAGAVIARLAELAVGAGAALVREASAAALGAIGHPDGLPAILHACTDKPHIRRRAVLALAPFDGPDVEAAIDRALADRDWQVRQAAEDLRRATGPAEL